MIDSGDVRIYATPNTVHWGYLTADAAPIATIAPGGIAMVDTISHEGLMPEQGPPAEFFSHYNIPRPKILSDAIKIYESVQHSALGPHILTGPIAITGARAGDVLAIDILDVELRTEYGVNSIRLGKGCLPDEFPKNESRVIPFDISKGNAIFSPSVHVPLRPFFGVMAVAPPKNLGRAPSGPPGPFGGNLDIKHLIAGTTLYLPVQVPGALFYVGDGHAAQGNGEVNVTAIEVSLTGRFRFRLLEDPSLTWPRAETPSHWICVGLGDTLDLALRNCLLETIKFLAVTFRMSRADAYSLASIAVDFEISQAVNHIKGVHGMIPKSIFK